MAPPDRRISRRRAAVSFERGQLGDVRTGDAAGESIYHQEGADPADVFDLVRFLWDDRQDRDVRREQLDHSLQNLRDTIELYRSTTLQRIEAVAVWQRRLTWWLAGLTVALVLGFALLALLIYDRYYAGAMLHYLAGAALALTLRR